LFEKINRWEESMYLRVGIVAFLTSSAAFLLGSHVAHAECEPSQFMVQDVQHVVFSDQLRIAFILTASKEEYDKANKDVAGAFDYGGKTGKLTYDQAQENARKEAQASNFQLDHDQYINLLSQKQSPVAAQMYSDCLEHEPTIPGLRIWFSKKTGNYVTLKSMWVGGNETQGVGHLEKKVVDNARVAEMPDQWPKASVEEIVLVKNNPEPDAFLSLKVGGQKKSFIVVGEPKSIPMTGTIVTADHPLVVKSGGSGRDDEWCKRHVGQGCVTPQHGGFLVERKWPAKPI
jgi:hypothetical protein